MSGKEWLKEDVKNEVLNRKPNMNINNKFPENSEHLESIEELENKKIMTPKR